jgi:hypothetical protein
MRNICRHDDEASRKAYFVVLVAKQYSIYQI